MQFLRKKRPIIAFTLAISTFSEYTCADDALLDSVTDTIKTVNNKSLYNITLVNRSTYDTNPLFANNGKEVFRNISTAKMNTRTVLETSELNLNAGLEVVRSSQQDVFFNQELPSASANWLKAWQNNSLDVRVDYRETSARSQELTENGLNFTDNTSVFKSIAGTYIAELTPMTNLALKLNQSYNNFRKSGAGLIGNDVLTASMQASRVINESLSALFNYSYTDFQPDNVSNVVIQAYGVGANWIVGQNHNLNLTIGSNSTSNNNQSSSLNYALNYNFEKESSNYSAQYNQSITPSALGVTLLSKRLSMSMNRQLSDVWSGSLSVSRSENENPSQLATASIFNNVNVGLTRQLTPDFKIDFSAGLQQIKTTSTIDSESVGINLTYNFSK